MRHLPSVLLVMLVALCSCEKELNFDYHDITPLTVIEGNLSEQGASVRLTLTTPMSEPMDTVPLTDATVTIADLTSGLEHVAVADAHGVYRLDTPGIPGHTYRLAVERGGVRHESWPCVMPRAVEITAMEMEWVKMPYDHVALLKVEFTDDTTRRGDAYWLRVYRNGEPYRWSVTDDRMTDTLGRISAVQMTTRRDTTAEDEDDLLRPGDVLTASVAPVDSLMQRYLEALTMGGTNGPAMFSGTVPALGYFLAAPVTTVSYTFHPDSIKW